MKKVFAALALALAAFAFSQQEQGISANVELFSGTKQRAQFLGIENDTVKLGGYVKNQFTVVRIHKDKFKSILDDNGNPIQVERAFALRGMYLEIGCASGKPGETVTVPVYVAGVPALAGFQLSVFHEQPLKLLDIESKINQINEELEKTDDGLPPISISVGVVNGKDATDRATLFEKTDEAMYESKKKGKHTYTFYNET